MFDIFILANIFLIFFNKSAGVHHPIKQHPSKNSRAENRLLESRPDLAMKENLEEAEAEIFEKMEFVRNRATHSGVHAFQKKTYSTIPRQFECYSCMSLGYQDNWEHLQYMYTTPKVFTNRCTDPSYQRIPTVLCGSFCASLLEPNVEGGVFLGYKYIRGCIDRILRHGFNQTALRTHRFNQLDLCRSLPRAQLFNPPQSLSMPVFGDVQLCSCYGDKCNGASKSPKIQFICVSTFLIPILSFIYINFSLFVFR